MPKSATEVMEEIVAAAVVDAALAFKAASKGVPNALNRALQAVHANSTPADLPAEVRDAIAGSVRAAFTRLLREGYAVAPASGSQARGPVPPRPRPAPRPPGKPPVVETKRRPPTRGGPGGSPPKGPPKPR